MAALKNDHKQEMEKMDLHHAYQMEKKTEKLKERCLEMERLLMKIHKVQQ